MSVQLLDRTRKINKLLHNSSSSKVVFNDICQVLMETLSSNILVLSKKGKVLGVSLCPGVQEITELIEDKVGNGMPVQEGLRLAAKASAIAVSRPGATASIPLREEVLNSSL